MFDTAITIPAVFADRTITDGIQTTGELGVDGIEFFDWEGQSLEAVVAACDNAGVTVAATLAAGAGSNIEQLNAPAITDPECKDQAIADIKRSIDDCVTLECPNLIITVGPDQNEINRSTQYDAIVDVLSAVSRKAEKEDVRLVIEPLNVRVDHPGYFLTRSDEAFNIIRDIDSPNVSLLFDIYHQQISEGDVTRRLTENIEHVGHVHIADNPGRNEPGTGEIYYTNVLNALAETGYDGYVGFEFSPKSPPEDTVNHVLNIIDRIENKDRS